jgi:D-sedoheptulose 7-phosphate isomerase
MINKYFNGIHNVLTLLDNDSISDIADLIRDCKGNIFVFGNGGSATTASHFAQDMNKCLDKRFICLTDNVASMLAYGNDVGFESIFKLQLSKLIKPGDLVIGISCSGNSRNIIDAIIFAKHFGYMTVGLTGFDGGELALLVDHNITVPCNDMQVCEDIHLIITHTILKLLSNAAST